jgi:phospholipid transport system substrate-binding protein
MRPSSFGRGPASARGAAFVTARIAAVLLCLCILRTGVAGSTHDEPGRYVAGLVERTVPRLAAMPPPARPGELRRLFDENVDLAGIARFILGRYWRTASENERAEFTRLFAELIVQTSDAGLAGYAGQRLRVSDARAVEDGEIIVRSELSQTDGPAIRIDWRLRQQSDGFKITDVAVEGISVRGALRDFVAAAVQERGGTIAALLAALRELVRVAPHEGR